MATIKRKRGRPRRVELTDDFDVTLIQEFEKRPDLYDRNAPNSKDKQYIEELWEGLANCLGYDVSIVKNRMVQIRNKYHLEKKRIETTKGGGGESKWPLYDQLSFLSEHIPIRRSFRTMRCRRRYSESEYVMRSEVDTEGSDNDRDRDLDYKSSAKEIPHRQPLNNQSQMKNYKSTVTFPRLSRFPPRHNPGFHTIRKPPSPESNSHGANDKFNAFGHFLTTTLIEMPENDALTLVDQFTSALVQAYSTKPTEETNAKKSNANDKVEKTQCNGKSEVIIAE